MRTMRMNDVYLSDLYDDEDDALEHHGVKGMKWGVRRYQNPDGSLTAEGRRHVQGKTTLKQVGDKIGSAAGKAAKVIGNKAQEYRVKRAEKRSAEKEKRSEIRSNKKNQKQAKKNPLNMTDDELRSTISRLEMEKRYKDLDRERHSGRTYAIDTLKMVGQKVLTDPNTYVKAMTGLYYLSQGKTADIALQELKNQGNSNNKNNKKDDDDD